MTKRYQAAVEHLQSVMSDHAYTPEQIAETTVHALYPKLSEGAANTYGQLGRGAVLMDLRDLDTGKLDTTYLPQNLLHRLESEIDLFGDAERAVADYDPLSEFVVIVWQTALIMVFRLQQL